jgi:hypothetical protein
MRLWLALVVFMLVAATATPGGAQNPSAEPLPGANLRWDKAICAVHQVMPGVFNDLEVMHCHRDTPVRTVDELIAYRCKDAPPTYLPACSAAVREVWDRCIPYGLKAPVAYALTRDLARMRGANGENETSSSFQAWADLLVKNNPTIPPNMLFGEMRNVTTCSDPNTCGDRGRTPTEMINYATNSCFDGNILMWG